MRFKSLYMALALLLIVPFSVNAQKLIGISPFVSEECKVPPHAVKTLKHKLTQIVTQSGYGSTSNEFYLTTSVVDVNKQAIPTVPVQYEVELEVSLYLVVPAEGIIIAEYPILVKGMESNESKAYVQALNQVNPRSPKIRMFMQSCREKIVDYYNTSLPAKLKKAETFATQGDYASAVSVLAFFPDCVEGYDKVAEKMSEYYQKQIDLEAQYSIKEAEALMVKEDYAAALDILSSVNPLSTKSTEAMTLIYKIDEIAKAKKAAELQAKVEARQRALEAEQRAYERDLETMQRTQDYNLKMAKITADAQAKYAAAIETKAAEVEKSVSDKIVSLLFGDL